MMSSTDAKAQLADFVSRRIDANDRAELSRLTAQFVAAVVREEREKASVHLRIETQRANSATGILEGFAKLNETMKRAKAAPFGSSL